MAEQPKPAAPAAKVEEKAEKVSHKASIPTNCQKCNKRIRRKSWYYHHNKYFCGKNCAKEDWKKMGDDKTKAAEAAAAAAAPKAEEAAPAAEAPKEA